MLKSPELCKVLKVQVKSIYNGLHNYLLSDIISFSSYASKSGLEAREADRKSFELGLRIGSSLEFQIDPRYPDFSGGRCQLMIPPQIF